MNAGGGREGEVRLSRIKMHYVEWGDGPRHLILLHGWTGWGHEWDRVATALQDEYHIFAPDQRGHGDSDKPESGYTLADYTQDLHEFIAAMRLDKPPLVGHSWGGAVGLVLAAQHPEDLSKLVCEDPVLSDRASNMDTVSLPRILSRKERSREQLLADFRQMEPQASDEDLEARLLSVGKFSAEALRQTLTVNKNFRFEEIYPRITIPTLMLIGSVEQGGIIPRDEVERVRQLLPGVEIAFWEDVGHSPHRTHLSRFLASLRRFLA